MLGACPGCGKWKRPEAARCATCAKEGITADHKSAGPSSRSGSKSSRGLYVILRVFGAVNLLGAVFAFFILLDEGFGLLGGVLVLQAFVLGLVLFAIASIGDGVDEVVAAARRG